jgi:oligopeptide transport system substrate-binding protein
VVPLARTVGLGFNASDSDPNNPFAQSKGETGKDLRVAIAESIDRADLIDKALDGVGAPAYTLVPQGVPGYHAYKAYDLNLTDAKAKLAAANQPNLSVTYVTRDREDQNKVAAVVQAQLKQNLGLDIQVKSVPWTTFLKERETQKYNFFYGSWGQDYPDPQDWLFPLAVTGQSENNEAWSNKQFDTLVTSANAMADPAKQTERFKMYNDAEKLLLDDAFYVPVYQFQTDYMLKPGWSGWGYNAQFTAPFRYLKKG